VSSPEGGRIKVLIALEGVLGGTLRHLDYLLRFADRREFDIHLAVSAERALHVRADFRRWLVAGWHVHEIPMRREIGPLADLRALRKLRKLCRRERFAVVHTHCAKAGFLGRLAARGTGARTIHTAHVFPFSHDLPDLRRALYLALERRAARWTDRFVLLTNYQLNQYLEAGLGPPEQAVVVPNGIVAEDFAGPTREEARRQLGVGASDKVALFAGRFCEQKGLDVLLGAAQLLAGTVPGLRILVVGEGPLEGWLAERVNALGLAGVVALCGRTDRMPHYYAACDVVVMPSRAEGMSYVVLEAKAAARPVVASLVTGMEELVTHGRDGYLVPPDNAEALADVLRDVLARPELLAEMGENARQGFRDDWRADRAARRVHDLYRELAAR
jgi:glycosyltransferase involved in cell wall biosynthesis